MIQTINLVKKYGDYTAVDDVNLNIRPGEIYGFLGPNGAGKTSTIKMLLGINRPTSGQIFLFGKKAVASDLLTKRRICAVSDNQPAGVWTWMTAMEYMKFFADIYELKNPGERINQLLKKVELYNHRNKPYLSFSKGMLQKLNIIRAILPDPDIVFLDEPINGLDPFGIKMVRDMILSENKEGRSILISSHLLSEMEKICNRIGIIFQGKIVIEDDIQTILSRLDREQNIMIEVENASSELSSDIKKLPFVSGCSINNDVLDITVPMDKDYRRELAGFIFNKGFIPIRIEKKASSLEEAFMQITRENIEKLTGKGVKL